MHTLEHRNDTVKKINLENKSGYLTTHIPNKATVISQACVANDVAPRPFEIVALELAESAR